MRKSLASPSFTKFAANAGAGCNVLWVRVANYEFKTVIGSYLCQLTYSRNLAQLSWPKLPTSVIRTLSTSAVPSKPLLE